MSDEAAIMVGIWRGQFGEQNARTTGMERIGGKGQRRRYYLMVGGSVIPLFWHFRSRP